MKKDGLYWSLSACHPQRRLRREEEPFGYSFNYPAQSTPPDPTQPSSSSSRHQPRPSSAVTLLSGASLSGNIISSFPAERIHLPAVYDLFGDFNCSDAFAGFPLRLTSDGRFLSGPFRSSEDLLRRVFRRSHSETGRRHSWTAPFRHLVRRRDPALSTPWLLGGIGTEQWAQAKAGEDRFHVVVSEEHEWIFVGVYDGFNGGEAADFLVCSLYNAVLDQLKGLFWDELDEDEDEQQESELESEPERGSGAPRRVFGGWLQQLRSSIRHRGKKLPQDKAQRKGVKRVMTCRTEDHQAVLDALSSALQLTEAAYFEMLEATVVRGSLMPLVGSCALAVLLRDDHVYVMNLGDSRAFIARYYKPPPREPERRETATPRDIVVVGASAGEEVLLLTQDHSTDNPQEVSRIVEEHPDDLRCIVHRKVKGRVKVTRAFGVAFLKEPTWNNLLTGMFPCHYVGPQPYISSEPSMCYHKIDPNDQFLVISSDGLYQYISNEGVLSHIRYFMDSHPDGDPAQSLIEEVLVRAAMSQAFDIQELLDVRPGDRRRFHDDVSVVVISFEGKRIWKSTATSL